MDKSLVCYFSATGITKQAAQELKEAVKGDLFEIIPTQPYTKEDLDWTNRSSRTSLEKDDETIRPSIKDKVSNMDSYQNIYIGFPVWWYKEPNIIDTFIEENNLENKNVYIFVTSGGSYVDGSFESLKEKYPAIPFVDGKRIQSKIDVSNWIQ